MKLYDGLDNLTTHMDDYDKWWVSQMPDKQPFPPGLDWNTWKSAPFEYDENLHATAWIGKETVDYIDGFDFDADKPLFLKSSFHRPHSPYDPPQRFIDQIDPTKMKAPVASEDDWDVRFKYDKACTGDIAWCGKFDEVEVNKTRRAYLANINFVDEWVGKILIALEKKGQLDNTIILFTSDHGDMQSDHWLWRKGYGYEGSTHIPMMMSWPKNVADRMGLT